MSRREKTVFYFLVFVGCLLTFAFGAIWFLPQHVPDNFHGAAHALDIVLFLALSYVVWHQIFTEILLWLIAETIQKPASQKPEPEPGLKVAFITTYVPKSEPLELLHSILPALQAADYPHDSWLLDEGASKEAETICKQYGVHYFTRHGQDHYNTADGKFAAKTKGGNHNAWYDACGHQYDIVAQIDTDFIPRKDFLTKTLGYFRDPRVAFVGTPQIYGNVGRSFVAKGAAEQGYTFYGPILQGLHGRKMTMLLGANHIVRVEALKDIDYYGGHLTEDLLTGMTLHSRRWKSVYVPEPLAAGEGPETWLAYFNQQMRWAFGAMHIFFTRSFRLLHRMSLEHKRYYFMLLQHYFTGVAMMLGVIIIVLNFVFGIAAASMGWQIVLYCYIPLVLWQMATSTWLQRFNIMPEREKGLLLAGKVVSMAAWPIYFLAFLGVVRGKRLNFKVTPKGEGQELRVPLRLFLPHITIGSITLIALGLSFVTDHQNAIIIFWSVVTIVSMYGVAFGAWLHGLMRYRALVRTSNHTPALWFQWSNRLWRTSPLPRRAVYYYHFQQGVKRRRGISWAA